MTENKHIILWLYSCCFMVFAMALIGAITRLTESGLSMVEWKPLIGALPPLNEEEWQRVYALYKQSPEFIHKHNWMALADFKQIFFWEWFHRLWGRLIGLVYTLPLLWFWITKKIPQGYGKRLLFILFLGGMQGVMGWYMVMSGLVDIPSVSHYRLAAHLSLAFIVFAFLWWTALDLKTPHHSNDNLRKGIGRKTLYFGWGALALLSCTIIWGAFVAGLDAGLVYNSFPLMNGHFFPPENFAHTAPIEQHGWVQFTHRWLAIITGLGLIFYALHIRDKVLLAMVLIQIGLGISTLLTQVMLVLAVLHQAGAIILLALVLKDQHRLVGHFKVRKN